MESNALAGRQSVVLSDTTYLLRIRSGGTIPGDSGPLPILDEVVLIGNGATIDARLLDNRAVLVVVGAGLTEFRDLTITKSQSSAIQLTDGTLRIEGMTVTGLESGMAVDTSAGSELVLVNSTLSGIANTSALRSRGSVEILFSTIVDNTTGISLTGGGTVTLAGTILADNTVNCAAPVISGGYNVESTNSCGLTDPTDQIDTDPLLGPLADNGGPTNTHLPSASSPALDLLVSETGCGIDQRGVIRPQGPACDAGSVER